MELRTRRVERHDRVGDLATQHPQACRVFERHKIDYCCGGKRSLEDACHKAGVPIERVLDELASAPAPAEPSRAWGTSSFEKLVAHIVGTHHAYTVEELPRISALADKVARVHGDAHPELVRLREVFAGLRDELEPHMLKEERVLFPYLLALESSVDTGQVLAPPPFGRAANPIRMMEVEHESAGEALAELGALTAQFEAPPEACGSWRALYVALGELERDLHQHIHLESNVLFPRALELEAKRQGPGRG